MKVRFVYNKYGTDNVGRFTFNKVYDAKLIKPNFISLIDDFDEVVDDVQMETPYSEWFIDVTQEERDIKLNDILK